MVAGLPLSADAYMTKREWSSLMNLSLSAYMGGLKRDGLSTDTILGYYYSQRVAPPFPITRECLRVSYFLVTIYL